MKEYSEQELRAALQEVGVVAGDTLLVHSALFALGRLRGRTPAEIPAALTDVLLESVGTSGTIVVPAFTFEFCKGTGFDRQHTPSEGMGVLSEYVRQRSDSRRSSHPMQSVAAIGSRADEICAPDTRSAFAEDGPFSVMIGSGARLLLLGAPMQSASLIHWSEERCSVPYRYWKEFSGQYVDQGEVSARTYAMYVRDLESDPRLELSRLEGWLRRDGRLRSAVLGAGLIHSCLFADFLESARDHLEQDPYSLISNPPPV